MEQMMICPGTMLIYIAEILTCSCFVLVAHPFPSGNTNVACDRR